MGIRRIAPYLGVLAAVATIFRVAIEVPKWLSETRPLDFTLNGAIVSTADQQAHYWVHLTVTNRGRTALSVRDVLLGCSPDNDPVEPTDMHKVWMLDQAEDWCTFALSDQDREYRMPERWPSGANKAKRLDYVDVPAGSTRSLYLFATHGWISKSFPASIPCRSEIRDSLGQSAALDFRVPHVEPKERIYVADPKCVTFPTMLVQIVPPEVVREYSILGPGRRWGGAIYVFNPNQEPLLDLYGFSRAYVENVDRLADERVRRTFNKEVVKVRQAYLSGKVKGSAAEGAGTTLLGLTLTEPLTERQCEGVFDGSVRIYVASWCIWRDSSGRVDTAAHCRWLERLPKRDYLKEEMRWQDCRE